MELKPIKKSGSIPVLQEIRGSSLTRVADEILLRNAVVYCEGSVEREEGEEGCLSFQGTVMVSIDLGAPGLRRNFDQQELLKSLKKSIAFHVRMMRIARRESEFRSTPHLVRGMTTELEFKIEDGAIFVDINVECPLADEMHSASEKGNS